MKKVLCVMVILLLVSIILISSIYLYNQSKEDNKQNEIFNELIDIVEIKENENTTSPQTYELRLKELYNANSDIVGWVKIENTNINYPVMQTKSNPNYYLRRNFYKEYSVMGTPYLAEQCDLNSSNNLIIYGHNISNNKMFADLEKYEEEVFYKQNNIIKFYTLENEYEYEIISVFKTIVDKGFKYYNYYNMDESKFNTFISKCRELALYDTNTSAEYGDKLITLSTCEYSQENGRLVVIAKQV